MGQMLYKLQSLPCLYALPILHAGARIHSRSLTLHLRLLSVSTKLFSTFISNHFSLTLHYRKLHKIFHGFKMLCTLKGWTSALLGRASSLSFVWKTPNYSSRPDADIPSQSKPCPTPPGRINLSHLCVFIMLCSSRIITLYFSSLSFIPSLPLVC